MRTKQLGKSCPIELKDIVEYRIESMFRDDKAQNKNILWELKYQRNRLTGQFLLNFDSISEASRRLNIDRSHIVGQLSGRYPHVRGLIFKYKEDK